MAKKHINPTLSAVIMECETDEDLRDTIRLLKGELERRQRRRLIVRLEKIVTGLTNRERKALVWVHRKSRKAIIDDLDVRMSLINAKLITGSGAITTLGHQVVSFVILR